MSQVARLDGEIQAPFKEAIRDALANNNKGAARLISSRIDSISQQAVLEIDKLIVAQQAAANLLVSAVVATTDRQMQLLYLCGAMTIVIGALIGWMLIRSITQPLGDAVGIATSVFDRDANLYFGARYSRSPQDVSA